MACRVAVEKLMWIPWKDALAQCMQRQSRDGGYREQAQREDARKFEQRDEL